MVDIKRMKQVLHYGNLHAKQIAKENELNRMKIFFDIVHCFCQYRMWSNQYLKEKFWQLSKEERHKIGEQYLEEGEKRDEWMKGFLETHKFLAKWTSRRWCFSLKKRAKRSKAYQKFYRMGENCFVDHNVEILRQHYLFGTIKIGNNVTFAKNVCIDYSGNVIIGDSVDIMDGVHIITHDHGFQHKAVAHNKCKNMLTAGELKIEYGAAIGSKAVIMPSCHYIGKFARVGAGAVVTRDVPDYAVVLGVPAKVTRYLETEIDEN